MNHKFQRIETERGILQGEDIPWKRKCAKYLSLLAELQTKQSFTLAKKFCNILNELNLFYVSL